MTHKNLMKGKKLMESYNNLQKNLQNQLNQREEIISNVECTKELEEKNENINTEIKTEEKKLEKEKLISGILEEYLIPFEDSKQKMLEVINYKVKIMEYCYNYLSKYDRGCRVLIPEETKEKDFKKLKELYYTLIKVIGYTEGLNEEFKKSLNEDMDENFYFELWLKFKCSAVMTDNYLDYLDDFVKERIRNETHNDYECLVREKNVVSKINCFEEEFGTDFYNKIFNVIDKNLCEQFLEEGKNGEKYSDFF